MENRIELASWQEAMIYAKNNHIDLFIDVNRWGHRFYKCNYCRKYRTFSNNRKGLSEFIKFIKL